MIAATVGSAVGLGAVWRFPNEVQQGGGAAFLLVYIVCLLLLGIPVMLAEFSLGRAVGSDAIGDYRHFTPRAPWWLTGTASVLATFLIMGFYMVVAGWTLEYLWQSITGALYDTGASGATPEDSSYFTSKLTENLTSVWSPIIWTVVVLAVNMLILSGGVQKGIERLSNLLMPLLFLLLVVLMCVTLTLPDASRGITFFLKPDFSAITPAVCISALGQAFFSLSLGMGILLTYSAYYPKNVGLTSTAFTVTGCALLVSLLMGLIIFPAVKSFGLDQDASGLQGTALVFVTLPEVFARMGFTRLWSTIFFALLAIAAITSTVSSSEVCIKCAQDRLGLSRSRAIWLVFAPLFILSPLCSLSLGSGASWLQIGGQNLFDFCDNFSTNYLLPLAALFTCLYVGWAAPSTLLSTQLDAHPGTKKGLWVTVLRNLLRYFCPLLIIAIFVFKLL